MHLFPLIEKYDSLLSKSRVFVLDLTIMEPLDQPDLQKLSYILQKNTGLNLIIFDLENRITIRDQLLDHCPGRNFVADNRDYISLAQDLDDFISSIIDECQTKDRSKSRNEVKAGNEIKDRNEIKARNESKALDESKARNESKIGDKSKTIVKSKIRDANRTIDEDKTRDKSRNKLKSLKAGEVNTKTIYHNRAKNWVTLISLLGKGALYVIVMLLLSIGATVLVNGSLRDILWEAICRIF